MIIKQRDGKQRHQLTSVACMHSVAGTGSRPIEGELVLVICAMYKSELPLHC